MTAEKPAYALDDEDPHYGAPSQRPPEPPTERDGLRVGDVVLLVPHARGPWPARIVSFLPSLDCCVVVEWTGKRPGLDDQNTICRKDLVTVVVERRPTANPDPGGVVVTAEKPAYESVMQRIERDLRRSVLLPPLGLGPEPRRCLICTSVWRGWDDGYAACCGADRRAFLDLLAAKPDPGPSS